MKEKNEHLVEFRQGVKSHIFFGHGATQQAFEKRDFGTTNEMVYANKQRTEAMINPHYYHGKLLFLFLFSQRKTRNCTL